MPKQLKLRRLKRKSPSSPRHFAFDSYEAKGTLRGCLFHVQEMTNDWVIIFCDSTLVCTEKLRNENGFSKNR